ncbi:MAG: TldD/PmbA family protein [Thermoprotei archaeon]|nr:TldD/PmbA family protein [Thermoprotei archaeon]
MDEHELLNALDRKGVTFASLVQLREEYYSWAIRGFSAEKNIEHNSSACLRVLDKGVWGVAYKRGANIDFKSLMDKALLSCKISSKNRDVAITGYADAPTVSTSYVYPIKISPMDVDDTEMFSLLSDIKARLEVPGLKLSEIILDFWLIKRSYWDINGSAISETYPLIMITMYTTTMGGQVSTVMGFKGGLELIRDGAYEWVTKHLSERVYVAHKGKALNPLLSGSKFDVVLDYDLAAAFIHESLGHALQADNYMLQNTKRLPIGIKIASEELTIYDDPTIVGGFGSYLYDDEGVRARRKVLVENGNVVSFINTRSSAAYFNVEPSGNGRGWTNVPFSLMSNLVVKPGDWRPNEIIEETRRGILLQGIIIGRRYENGAIVLEAENGAYIEKGEIKDYIRGPLILRGNAQRLLLSITAIGKYLLPRPSFEKGLPVSEYAPILKLSKARIYAY